MLKADVELVAVNANTEKKSTVPAVSKRKERCFGANAYWRNAVLKKDCRTADNAKVSHATSCKSSLMIKNKEITAKELKISKNGIIKVLKSR